jgi:anti-sigma B factor antagonist
MHAASSIIPLRLVVDRQGHVLELRASGELDLLTGPSLLSTIIATIEPGCREVRVDLADVRFIDTAGLDALLRCREALSRQAARFVVVHPSRAVRLVADLTGDTAILEAAP